MNNQEFGAKLEAYIQDVLEAAGVSSRRISRRGGRGGPLDSDLLAGGMQIECKRRHGKLRMPTKAEWEKTAERAQHNCMVPVLAVAGDRLEDCIVTLRLKHLLLLIDTEELP